MDNADREYARRRIQRRRQFVATAVTLVVVELLLIVVWYLTGAASYFWPIWPALGFAVAIVFSGLNAFGILNRDVSEGDVDAELARMNRKSAG